MATQTELTLEQLPYGYEAGLLTALLTFPGKVVRAILVSVDTLGEAIAMRNRFVELTSLSDRALKDRGIDRDAIPQVVAFQAGLLSSEAAPLANSNVARSIRPAA